ncbi:TATA box binding protein associated factor-domain-containing protein [Infundibulicybe gibba]|nr:TATA box binding protein associated factor-domain-containing protein [Infundibulicybe gibba]
MNKPKAKGVQAQPAGVYKPDSIRDAAESLGITISDTVASALASDVEYRIHQVIEEAARFMRHGRRTSMSTGDIDQALRVLNIEPLYGHSPYNPPTFRRALPFPQAPTAGPVYFVEDEEIDFDRVLREDKIALPKGVSWNAHWLAVEGVQPLIPENPPAIPKEPEPEQNKQAQPQQQQQQQQQQNQQLVKQVLSRELQLYYTRLTSSLLPPSSDFAKRTAALASLRNDAGLQALLPYLIRWVGEGVVGALKEGVQSEADGKVLQVLLDVISAILDNNTLFVEPYLHQILPPILSTLLHSSLPPTHATYLRTSASQTLSRKNKGTREGAIRGLVGVGKEAVRKGLVEGGGAKVVGSECSTDDSELIESVMHALKILHPPSDMADALDMSKPEDVATSTRLRELVGDFFAEKLSGDAEWARGIIGTT